MQFNRYFSYFCGVLLKKKKIDRTIDMRNIPTITKNLLIINVIAFLAYYVLSLQHIDLNNLLGLHFFLASDFHLYQLVTYMFMHANLQHIFFNMFALWMFGCVIENVWGPKKFLFYYISCGVGAGLIQELTQLGSLYVLMNQSGYDISLMQLFSLSAADAQALNAWTTVGASGAIYAILLAFGMLFPEERLFIFPLPVPIKAKWLITAYLCQETGFWDLPFHSPHRTRNILRIPFQYTRSGIKTEQFSENVSLAEKRGLQWIRYGQFACR